MRIWIPNCGDAAILDADWTFHLHPEGRNSEFCGVVKGSKRRGGEYDPIDVRLPQGTELVVDRIYIRQTASDYASVTFIIKDCPIFDWIGERFWAKLEDVNRMDATPTSTGNPVGGVVKLRYKTDAKAKTDPSIQKKRDAKKLSDAELAVARQACSDFVVAAKAGADARHVDQIIQRINSDLGSQHYSYYVRPRMESGYGARKSDVVWACESTKLDESTGNKTRRMRFAYYGKKYAGFDVVTNGTTFVSITPIL